MFVFFWLSYFSFEVSFNACLLNSDLSQAVRFSINNEIKCENSNFIGKTSQEPGGVLFVDQSNFAVKLISCLFLKCSSFGSIQMARNCSGGAICCRVSYNVIQKCNFVECSSIAAGIVAYIYGGESQTSTIEECSATKMKFQSDESDSSIIMTDYVSCTVSKVNFSKPLSSSYPFFFGMYPKILSINKVYIAGDNIKKGLELSSYSSQTDISTIIFVDLNASDGLFFIWVCSVSVSDIHVANCKGALINVINNAHLAVTNSWIGNGIYVDSSLVTLGENVKLEDSLQISSMIFVIHYINNLCSLNVTKSLNLLLILALFSTNSLNYFC